MKRGKERQGASEWKERDRDSERHTKRQAEGDREIENERVGTRRRQTEAHREIPASLKIST